MDTINQSTQNRTNTPLFMIVGLLALGAIGAYMVMGNRTPAPTQTDVTVNNGTTAGDTQNGLPESGGGPGSSIAGTTGMTATPMAAGAVKTITMEAGSFYYTPKIIQAKKGDTIRVVMTSKDMMHDFNIDELDVDGPVVKSGETATIEFTADKVGSFEFYCSVGQHRQNGQVGTLTVTE